MQELEVETVADADLTNPVFVEGLPGVGHVGKLVAEHVVEEGESTLVRRVYSEHFPPQVTVGDEGVAELAHVEVHAVETEGRDLLVLTGDHQAQENAGHYRVTDAFLDIAEEFGVSDVFALGGVPTGELIEEYGVVGAVSDEALAADLEEAGVEFRSEEPAGGIVGTSGLLLGLGGRRGFDAACLMGETSGYLVDPKSAKAVLEVLESLLGFDVDFDALDERADEMEDVVEQMQQMEQGPSPGSEDDLRYIG
ncbi:proteasome assembly chaperone family protein [Salarchaeum japonicum]|uniref:Proteasome assembly chaperone family protein n=1 Tax=Salarchaeum japonicum TaxID=555573 RepID=A0AAV3T526_9EURY|nr:proteasome assembly chaperone family protein [Salarchaeum japonicum]